MPSDSEECTAIFLILPFEITGKLFLLLWFTLIKWHRGKATQFFRSIRYFLWHNGRLLLLSRERKLPGFQNLGFGSPPTWDWLLLVARVTEGTWERGTEWKAGLEEIHSWLFSCRDGWLLCCNLLCPSKKSQFWTAWCQALSWSGRQQGPSMSETSIELLGRTHHRALTNACTYAALHSPIPILLLLRLKRQEDLWSLLCPMNSPWLCGAEMPSDSSESCQVSPAVANWMGLPCLITPHLAFTQVIFFILLHTFIYKRDFCSVRQWFKQANSGKTLTPSCLMHQPQLLTSLSNLMQSFLFIWPSLLWFDPTYSILHIP